MLLHGGAQNAHTWDTVALALARPAISVDLPGHGHSDEGQNGSLDVRRNADDVAEVVRAFVDGPAHVVGMSLGGLTSLALADRHPELVESVMLVDITPGVNAEKSRTISAFVHGPDSFDSFDAILARTIKHNPTRSVASLRRGILHNAVQREDGAWVWRYARFREPTRSYRDFHTLWSAIDHLPVPLCLARGMRDGSVVDDADEAELLRRQPSARVEHFIHAGHSVQGDTPVGLAELIADFTDARRVSSPP